MANPYDFFGKCYMYIFVYASKIQFLLIFFNRNEIIILCLISCASIHSTFNMPSSTWGTKTPGDHVILIKNMLSSLYKF